MTWIPAHELYRSIGPEKGRGITLFNAFTVVSAFGGKGKKSALQSWVVSGDTSDIFARLSLYPPPPRVNDNEMDTLDNFVVMMYDRSSTATCVNNARFDMFCSEAETMLSHSTNSISLTSARLACCLQPETHIPADRGCAKNGYLWNVVRTLLLPIVESCQQLTKCGCKSE